jgi:probable HAF family extracellular repeat protein
MVMTNLRQCAIWVLGISLLAPPAVAQSYTITDLGLLPGSGASYGYGVNDLAQVVGTAAEVSGVVSEAFSWTKRRGIRELKIPSGYSYVAAYAINNLGDAVGGAYPPGGGPGHVMLWGHNGEVLDLGIGPNFTFSVAYDVNDLGVVAGWGDSAGFIWTRSRGFHVLGTLPGGVGTVTWRINLHNHVVGFVDFPNGNPHAFLWTEEQGMQDLGFLPGGSFSEALGNNNFGQIVGTSDSRDHFGSPLSHAVVWQEGGEDVHDLGTLPSDTFSIAWAINDFGEIVGSSNGKPGSTEHAFVWTRARGLEDLNNLIPPDSGWVLNVATFVNLEGMISGYGIINGESQHAFLLTPKK